MSELPSQRLAAVAAGPFIILLIAVALAIQGGNVGASHEPTHNGGMQAMSIDLDITGNTATSLGPQEDCTQVRPGDTVTFDVTAEGIPESTRMIAFHTRLTFPASVSVQSRDANFLLASTTGSAILEVSTTDHDDPNTWNLQAADISDWAIIPPESGSGVLLRVITEVSQSAPPGTYLLPMSETLHIDQLNNTHLANTTNNATLVIGGTCDNPPTSAPTVPNPPTPPTPGTSPVLTPTSVATPWPPPDSGGMESMSIDLDVSGNTATSVGPRDNCIEVNAGDTLTFDVTAEGIPDSSPMIAFTFELGYTQGAVQIETASADYLITDKTESSLFDASEPMPDGNGTWIAAVLDIGEVSTASESGSGVLIRAGLSVSASAAAGLYPLTLSMAAHIDPLAEVRLPAALNWAYLAIGATCENLPTPPPTPVVTTPPTPAYTPPPVPTQTSTPAVTPGPGAIPVGIDHNGGTPDINSGPLLVSVGQTFTMRLVMEPPPGLVGAWEAEFHYEPSAMTVISCIPHPGSVCNTAFANNTVKVAGVALSGLPGASNLAEITFTWSAAAPVCVAVGPSIQTLADTTGSPLFSYVSIGLVCEEGAATPDAQQPTPMPSAPPTPPPTYPPFPSPTPGGTAGPTPAPDGGPPVSEPTAAAQAQTSAPTPAPSTPSSSPTSSAKPTPTALGAVALPQTGGTGVGTSAALPVAVIGMAGLLAGSAAWLSLRRRPEHR